MPVHVRGFFVYEGQRIPGDWINDPASHDGRRFEASVYGYAKLRRLKCQTAMGRCTLERPGCLGKAMLQYGELHHTGAHGRGMGGAWRDDRETVWTCAFCHEIEESKRTRARWSASHKRRDNAAQ